MNDHDLDALASDILDGLLPADESGAALREPAVAQRVAEMRAAQALVREVPAVDPARREAGLSAALAAASGRSPGADTPSAPATPAVPAAPATSDELAARRGRPQAAGRARRHVPGWLTAAAVLLLVAAFGGLVATVGGSDSDDAGTSSDVAAPTPQQSSDEATSGGDDGAAGDSEADRDASAAESSGGAPGDAPTTTTPATGSEFGDQGATGDGSPVDLGEVASVDEVASGVSDIGSLAAAPPADEVEEARAAASEPLARFATCRPVGAEDGPGRTVSVAAVATLDGRPVAAWVVAEAGVRTVIVADAGCTVVGERTIPG